MVCGDCASYHHYYSYYYHNHPPLFHHNYCHSFEANKVDDVKSVMEGLAYLSFLPSVQIQPRVLTEDIKVRLSDRYHQQGWLYGVPTP